GAAVALAALVMAALAVLPARAADLPVVRVGVLKFGTVSWELDVLRRHGLDRAHGVVVEPLELAGKDGAAVVRQGGDIKSIVDLKGRKIGIGGGPVDKSWLVLRAYAKKTAGIDLAREAQPVFAAPPLLNETLKRGDVPAAINFWQYNARLPEGEFVELVRVEDMLPALGLSPETPLLG